MPAYEFVWRFLVIFPIMQYVEAAGVPTPTDVVGVKMSLDQVIGDLGASVAQAREMLAKSAVH